MLYRFDRIKSMFELSNIEQTILKTYDIFQFYEISIKKYEIEKFEKLLSKYLVLIKLNNYNIYYLPCPYLFNFLGYNHDKVDIKFNGFSIKLLYKNHILSLNDLIDIKNILLNNFHDPIKYEQYFYFKSYEDAKDFLIKINKKDVIKKY